MKRIIILSTIIVVCFLVIILLIINPFKKSVTEPVPDIIDNTYSEELINLINKNIEHGKLVKIIYSNNTEINGEYDVIELDITNKTLITKNSSSLEEDISLKEYKVNEDKIKEIEEIINKYNLIAWSTIQAEPVLDGPETLIRLVYDNESIGGDIEYYTISFNSKMPREGYGIVTDLANKLKNLKIKDNLLDEYKEKDEKK